MRMLTPPEYESMTTGERYAFVMGASDDEVMPMRAALNSRYPDVEVTRPMLFDFLERLIAVKAAHIEGN